MAPGRHVLYRDLHQVVCRPGRAHRGQVDAACV